MEKSSSPPFLVPVIRLISGGVVGQAVLAAAVPLLSRLVTPAEYGVFAAAVAIGAILGLVSTLRLELAVPVVKDRSEAYVVQWTALSIAALFSVSGLVCVLFLRSWIATHSPAGYAPWLFTPFGMLGTAALQAVQQRITRERDYPLGSLVVGLQPVLQVLFQVSLLSVGVSGATALIAGFAASTLGAACLGLWRIHARYDRNRPSFGLHLLFGVASKYREYPAVYTPAALLNVLILQAPTVVLASTLGAAEAGLFGLATRILSAPVSLVVGAYSRVFFAEASAAARAGSAGLHDVVSKTLAQLTVISVLTVSAGLLFTKPTLGFVLGGDWDGAAVVVKALLPLYASQIIVAPITQVTNVLGRHKVQLATDSLRFVVAASVLAISAVGTIGLAQWTLVYSLTSAATYMLLLSVLFRLASTSHERVGL